jgi:hypothetical protein
MSVKPTTLEELLVRLSVTVANDVPLVPMSPAVEARLTLVPETVPVPLIDEPLIVLFALDTVPSMVTAPPAAIEEDVTPVTEPVAPTVVPVPEVRLTVLPPTEPLMAVLVPELKLIVSALVVPLTTREPVVDSFNVPSAPTVEFNVNEPVFAI